MYYFVVVLKCDFCVTIETRERSHKVNESRQVAVQVLALIPKEYTLSETFQGTKSKNIRLPLRHGENPLQVRLRFCHFLLVI